MNQDKLQVLHIAPKYFPSKGGVETHLAAINAVLVADGHAVTVITTQQTSNERSREVHKGVEIMRLPIECQNNKFKTWLWFWHNRTLLQNKKVFVHDVAWQIVPLLPQLYKKFCLIFHGWEGIFPVPLKNILQRRFFASAAAYTVHVGDFIEEFYGDHPSQVIYGGVESSKSAMNIRSKQIDKNKLQFIFMGRLEKVNELELYLDFFEILGKRKVEFSVTWMGDGSYRDRCEKFGTVIGMVDDVQSRLSDADFVCANSYLSIFEAQAQTKVVLSLYSNSLKESYLKKFPGASAMLIASSAEELNLKLTNLLSNKSHLLQLQTAAQKVAETFSWKKVASIYENIAYRL